MTHEERLAKHRAYNAAHAAERAAYAKAYKATHRELLSSIQRAYRIRHKAADTERKRIYERANVAIKREALRRWRRRHPGAEVAKSSRRRAAQIKATPSWANQSAIKAIYTEAARLTQTTGIPHHVDHIYPLRGLTVCGLHVEHNLQILTKAQNLRKLNKHPESLVA